MSNPETPQTQFTEAHKEEMKSELRRLREIVEKLDTAKLRELEDWIQNIKETIDEVYDVLSGYISAVMLRFSHEGIALNSIEIYGFRSGKYYATLNDRTEISTKELQNALSSPEVIRGAIKVLVATVEELVETIKDIVENELEKREPPDP